MSKFLLCVVLVTVAIATVQSYDGLDDIIDNMGEFQPQAEPVKHKTRTVRETEEDKYDKRENEHGLHNVHCHKRIEMNACCKVDDSEERHKYRKLIIEYSRECNEEIYGDPELKMRRNNDCFFECLGQKLNYIDENKIFDEDAFKEFVNETMATVEHHKAIAEIAVEKCILLNKPADGEVVEPDGERCDSLPKKLFVCVWLQFFRACPKELRNNVKECKVFRQALERAHINY